MRSICPLGGQLKEAKQMVEESDIKYDEVSIGGQYVPLEVNSVRWLK